MDSYRRPDLGEFSAELEIKRSRFIGFVARTETEDEARAFISNIRGRFSDARHHCSAFIIHQDGAQPIERSSDDGEPSGTAGMPMLDVLRGLQDVTAVVVRYFGGVLLGTGGLVRAYQDSTKAALAETPIKVREQMELREITVDHGTAGRLESELRIAGHHVVHVDYGARVTMSIGTQEPAKLEALIAQATSGGAKIHDRGTSWIG